MSEYLLSMSLVRAMLTILLLPPLLLVVYVATQLSYDAFKVKGGLKQRQLLRILNFQRDVECRMVCHCLHQP